jgi:hypothetical protein
MNSAGSARDVSRTDWVTAAMAGRGSDTPPPPETEQDRKWGEDLVWAIVWTVTYAVMTVAAYAAFGHS